MAKKKILRFLATVIIGIGIICFLMSTALHDAFFYKTLTTEASPNNINRIEIKYKDAAFFGPNEVRIIIKQKNHIFHKVKRYDSKIFNDGGRLESSNSQIKWENDNYAIIILDGAEQKPEIIEVRFESEILITFQ